jgi:hypothetical protein
MIKRTINANGNEIEFEIFPPNEKYGGKTYGEWLAESWKKLMAEDPDKTDGPIFFLRTSPCPEQIPFEKKVEILSNQAVFVPIITAAMNDKDSSELNSEKSRREAANRYIDEGDDPPQPPQVTINGKPIIDDLKDFRVQSPEFDLTVDERCPIRGHYPGGTFQTVAAGYCIIIKSLPPRDEPYTIRINARGKDGYRTQATYMLRSQ